MLENSCKTAFYIVEISPVYNIVFCEDNMTQNGSNIVYLFYAQLSIKCASVNLKHSASYTILYAA